MAKKRTTSKKVRAYEKKVETEDRKGDSPPGSMFQEVTTADSYMNEKYQLRPYNPDDLWQKKGNYDLVDTMREDDQISGLLYLKKLLIVGKWEIESETDGVEVFLKWNLCEGLDELFDKKMINMLSGIDYGFSLTEKIFKPAETPYGQKIILSSLKTRAPHSFEFETDNKGNIEYVRQLVAYGKDLKIDIAKFIHYTYQKEFDNPYGKSELNTGVYRAWWSKDNIIKFWNMYLEKYGMPTAVGKYPKSGGGKDKSDFKKVLKNIQAATAVTMPDDFTVDLLQAAKESTSGGFEAAVNKHDTSIARHMLFPDLTGVSGASTGGGSYSLGQEHFGMLYETINNERKQLELLINREIITPLVLWNFGKGAEAKFRFITIDQKKKDMQLKNFLEAIKSGKIPPTPEHINHFLKEIDFPEISEEEFAKREQDEKDKIDKEDEMNRNKIEAMKKNPLVPGQPVEPVPPIKEKPKDKKNPIPPIKPEIKKKTEQKDFAGFYRELTVYEQRVDFVEIQRVGEKINDGNKDELAQSYKLSINGLVDEIKRKKIIERKRLDLVNGLTLKGTSKITKQIKGIMVDGYKLGTVTAKAEIKKKDFLVDTIDVLSDEEVALWLNEFAFYVSNMEAGFILGKVKPILMETIRNGSSTVDAINQIDKALKGYDITVAGGLNRIETIVRTTTSKAFNQARTQEFEKVKTEIIGYQYSAILDNRTSDICNALDNQVFKPSEMNTYNPPNHFNCRSLLVPVFKDEEVEFTDVPAVEKDAGDFLKLKK